ncbi:MAG: hypothetical protein KIT14_06945 [bacterium]|nr:hypothetical protein [bacterium]
MTKLKGAAILGCLVVAGATLLSSLPASSATSFLLVSGQRLAKACRGTGATEPICKFVANAVDRLAGVDFQQPVDETVVYKMLRKLRGPVKKQVKQGCCGGLNRCDACVHAVSNVEAYVATNGSVHMFSDTLQTACDGRFGDPVVTAECKGQIDDAIAPIIDWFLANYPPVIACQSRALRACAP